MLKRGGPQYERDATSFESGSEGQLEILHMAASDGLAYWVGFQRATAHLLVADQSQSLSTCA